MFDDIRNAVYNTQRSIRGPTHIIELFFRCSICHIFCVLPLIAKRVMALKYRDKEKVVTAAFYSLFPTLSNITYMSDQEGEM